MRRERWLIACEETGRVRDEFIKIGHDAVSCDILPSRIRGPHIQGDVLKHLDDGWDGMVAFPPCTFLCNSGIRWLFGGKGTKIDKKRWSKMIEACEFFLKLYNAKIPKKGLENSVMHPYAQEIIKIEPSQIIQPWLFGWGEQKATALWLKELPLLIPTDVVSGRRQRVLKEPPSKDRGRKRAATCYGIAEAMAEQWGKPQGLWASIT